MDDKPVRTVPANNGIEKADASKSGQMAAQVPDPTVEHRQAYGTAKTENLRDSGLWRIILPAFVIVCCLVLFAIPLIILVPLLTTALDPHSASRMAGDNLIWVWITLIVLALGTAAVIVQGLYKIFLTQAGNYHK